MLSSVLPLLAVLTLTIVLPTIGAWLGGLSLSELIKLPLVEPGWDALPPDPTVTTAVWLLTGFALAAVLWLARPVVRAGRAPQETSIAFSFPGFTWFGLFALIAAIMAIDGGAINVAIGLILAALTLFADADTQRRTGNSLIQQQPGYFSSLFAASFVIGWCCYWLNLYLQLWTYPAATETVPFVLGKSLYYALLLPAVLSLRQWLASWPLLLDLTSRARPLHIQTTPGQGIVLFGIAATALLGASLWSDWIYPLALLAPLLLAISLQQMRGQPTILSGLADGNWSRILLPAAATIIIGLVTQASHQLFGPAYLLNLPLIGGPALLGLPLPAWPWLALLGLLGIWIADQLTTPWKQRPRQPRYRPRFPIKVVVEDRLAKPNRR